MVDSIEKSLPFWVDRMGFTKTVDVPEGDGIGFAILAKDGGELMLQTVESVRKDTPQFVPAHRDSSAGLFIEVDDFADILKRLNGYKIDLPERTTFYGMKEIGVREPGGHIVVFAARQ
jgi:catechol 2,3-dioxygenase-like lactoylglutathione lyase family enzyme